MPAGQCKVGENKSAIVRELPECCACDVKARDFLERERWGTMPHCPCCGSTNVYVMRGRDGDRERNGRWRCRDCSKRYTVRTASVMEDSKIPLRHWCLAFWRITASKKGVSAKGMQRLTGLDYRSAHFLMHRVRFGMANGNAPKLEGVVECDETYVGGKPRARIAHSETMRRPGQRSNFETRKDRHTPVFAALQRGGEVRVRVMARIGIEELRQSIEMHVHTSATLMTDELRAYKPLGMMQEGGHHTVCHSAGEYARGEVSTNSVEGFFAIFKRGFVGIYHCMSRKHLHRYVAESAFRFNGRALDDGDRAVMALRAGVGKRLTYCQMVGKPPRKV